METGAKFKGQTSKFEVSEKYNEPDPGHQVNVLVTYFALRGLKFEVGVNAAP
jgi:hypothetical protein